MGRLISSQASRGAEVAGGAEVGSSSVAHSVLHKLHELCELVRRQG